MSVKVLIERWVRAGHEGAVWDTLRHMRAEAARTRGYLRGETWRSLEDPRVFMVLGEWGSEEYWRQWAGSDVRLKMEERMASALRKPAQVRLFVDAAEPPQPATPARVKRRNRKQPA